MEKNGNNSAASDSKGVCEKILSAITVSPAFRAIRRAVHFPQEPKAASHASSRDAPQPQPQPQPNKSAESAPVVIQIPITSQGERDINDIFSEYIDRTKDKFNKSTQSNLGS
ncbi:hypothetical protein COP1_031287 [Malus domestica]